MALGYMSGTDKQLAITREELKSVYKSLTGKSLVREKEEILQMMMFSTTHLHHKPQIKDRATCQWICNQRPFLSMKSAL